jgi:hypothetical protein
VSAPAIAGTSTRPTRDDDGYYHMPDGRKLMSVTTVIENGVPKPGLVHWAAIEVAKCAMDYLPRLLRARGEEARENVYQWLRRAAERRRDSAADLGTSIHDAVEASILGTPWPEPTDEQRPFLEAFSRFCDRWQPDWEASEMVVANLEHGWAGKGDAWARLVLPDLGPKPILIIIDWKSGKNIYPEVALQLSAYARAEVGWLRDGTMVTPPQPQHAAVVHLRPDKYPQTGGYRIRPVDITDATYTAFRNAQATAEDWVKGRSKTVIGKAYPEPDPVQKVA